MQNKLFKTEETPSFPMEKEEKEICCARCGKHIVCWTLIKKQPWCCDCVRNLKDYFQKKDDSSKKNIRICVVCRKFKEIVYTDGYRNNEWITFCKDCLTKHQPKLLLENLK